MTERLPAVPESGERLPQVPAEGSPPAYRDEWLDYSEPGAEGGGASLRRAVLGIRRYWWLVVLAACLGAVGGWVAYETVKPTYTAQASLLVETRGRDAMTEGPVRAGQLMEETSLLDLLRAPVVTQPVVMREHLYLRHPREEAELFSDFELALVGDTIRFRPGAYILSVSGDGEEWRLATEEGEVVERGAPGDSIGLGRGFLWAPSPSELAGVEEVDFTVLPPPEAAMDLAARIEAGLNRQGNFINVSLADRDPETASRFLNGILNEFSRVVTELKDQQLDASLADLEQQTDSVRTALGDARQQLQQYRMAIITEPDDRGTPAPGGTQETRAPVLARISTLRQEREQLSLDRSALQRILDGISGSGVPIPQLEQIPTVASSSQLGSALGELAARRTERRQLLEVYTPEYPPVERLSENIQRLETEVIPGLIRSTLAALNARLATLNERIASTEQQARQIPGRMGQEEVYSQAVEDLEVLNRTLTSRLEIARLANQSSLDDFSILSPATPPFSPSNDPRLPMAGAVFLGFLGLGLAGAVVLDRMDKRFRYPEDITVAAGVDVLGMVPRIKGKGTQFEVEEAFRDLRMRLMYAHGTAGPLMVVFSSPGPGEGKTLVTANLALAFAKIGRKTLVIDGDTRRGDLHKLLDAERTPGLVDFLAGNGDGKVIHRTEYPNLFFLGSGSRLARAPELLAGERIRHLFRRLKESYDVILVDAPPLGAGADAFHLATLTGSLALVVRSGESEKSIVEKKLQALAHLPVRVLGGILNDVASSSLKGYGYYSYYLPGYEAGQEDASDPTTSFVGEIGPGEIREISEAEEEGETGEGPRDGTRTNPAQSSV